MHAVVVADRDGNVIREHAGYAVALIREEGGLILPVVWDGAVVASCKSVKALRKLFAAGVLRRLEDLRVLIGERKLLTAGNYGPGMERFIETEDQVNQVIDYAVQTGHLWWPEPLKMTDLNGWQFVAHTGDSVN
jgi:hypothetical protein